MPNNTPSVQCSGPGIDSWGKPVESERCTSMVKRTKPSKTGHYFCSKKACQNYRARQYQRERRQTNSMSPRLQRLTELMFVADAIRRERVVCPDCNLQDAIPGWPHRNADAGPCFGVRHPDDQQRGLMVDMIDAVWPHPRYGNSDPLLSDKEN